jgi:hypothetical protein
MNVTVEEVRRLKLLVVTKEQEKCPSIESQLGKESIPVRKHLRLYITSL